MVYRLWKIVLDFLHYNRGMRIVNVIVNGLDRSSF